MIALILFLIIRQIMRQSRDAQRAAGSREAAARYRAEQHDPGPDHVRRLARVVTVNQRYIDMFGLSPEIAKPGCTLRDLVQHRKDTGSFEGDVDEFAARIPASDRPGPV